MASAWPASLIDEWTGHHNRSCRSWRDPCEGVVKGKEVRERRKKMCDVKSMVTIDFEEEENCPVAASLVKGIN